MQKNTRYIVVICVTAVLTVLLLQFYWIKEYYKVSRSTFEKEVNMAFEDALKKEFGLRCDTIQHLIAKKLMDTTEFKITSEFDRKITGFSTPLPMHTIFMIDTSPLHSPPESLIKHYCRTIRHLNGK
jgi:hypothetical protein